MSLIASALLSLGASVAKSIFKAWLKDSDMGTDVSASLVDLIEAKTSNMFERRKGERLFEDIGDEVSKSLFKLFKIEGDALSEASCKSVAEQATQAFENSKLSSQLLAQYNLDPARLKKYILSIHPNATRLFDLDETILYERIIHECCKYIVDIASHMPTFTEHTFAELLRRDDQILDVLKDTREALYRLNRIREANDPSAEAGRFELAYRDIVARNLDRLKLLGVDNSTSNRFHRLSVAYITLSVERVGFAGKNLDNSIRNRIPVENALAYSRRLLIRGQAGSGKTTLLQWIAVRSASRTFEGVLQNWNDTIPFFIKLREYVQVGLPGPERFANKIASLIVGEMPVGWIHTQLRSGRAIVLVDGIDELPPRRRDRVRDWLDELVTIYPSAYFIVTSRSKAVAEDWLSKEDFDEAELQAMDLTDIYAFIERWHKALREELSEEDAKSELLQFETHLKGDVRYTRAIRNLATNPLMCAMLCVLNRDRHQHLPIRRFKLYETCCELLCERRDIARGVDLSDYPALDYEQKLSLLQDLAYWMIENSWSEVTFDKVEEYIVRKLKKMPNIPQGTTGFNVLKLFLERTSIIQETAVKRVDFTHRTFQEYLAARAAADDLATGVLLEHAQDDQWREVIILSAAIASEKMRNELIKELIERGDMHQKHKHYLHLLAVSCLEATVDLDENLKQAVELRLEQLVPPKNMNDAKSLSAAGELAVRYLAKTEKMPGNVAAASVRTLALIGGESALEMIEGYATDPQSAVREELIKAWDAFDDRKIYAQCVLAKTFISDTHLNLKSLSSLEGIQYFVNVTSLSLENCKQISDLTPLTGLMQLIHLDISACDDVDLTPLGELTQLTSLSLLNCSQLTDLAPLVKLNGLASLSFAQSIVFDISPLQEITSLISLDFTDCRHISNFSPLRKLTKLEKLNLTHCHLLASIVSLADLINLQWLSLYACSQVQDISILQRLTQIRTLNITNCVDIKNLFPLAGMIHMEELNLAGCFEVSSVMPLANMTGMISLTMAGCGQVQDIKPLAGMTLLKRLDLKSLIELQDITPLANMKQLTHLNLAGCSQVQDLSPLSKMALLEWLDLSDCQGIVDLRVLESLENLKTLKLDGLDRTKLIIPPMVDRYIQL